MMSRVMRQKSREAGDFASPFEESYTARPLGEKPLLVHAVDIKDGGAGKAMALKFRDAANREIALEVSTELLLNLLSLMEQALAQSEWALNGPAAPAGEAPVPAPPGSQRLLN